MKIVVNEIGVPVVVEGEARPMMPDSFVDWLEPRLTKDMDVFEWGSGNSTLWLFERVHEIVSVDHHILWYRAMDAIFASLLNTGRDGDKFSDIGYCPNDQRYENHIDGGEIKQFDVIFIDGVRRDECIHEAVPHLSEGGVIVLDNSDSEAAEGQQWLKNEQGFSSITFSGVYNWATNDTGPHETTVFYRPNNCLNI